MPNPLPSRRLVNRNLPGGSTASQVRSVASRYGVLSVPPNVNLSEVELVAFQELARAREPTDWELFEARDLVRVAKVEAMADEAIEILKQDGLTTIDRHGQTHASPVLMALTRLLTVSGRMREKLGLTRNSFRAERERDTRPEQRAATTATVIEEADGLLAAPVPAE